MEELLGIGSRIKHADFGLGVVINVKSDGYMVTFIDYGTKQLKFTTEMEVVHKTGFDADMVSMFDVERTLTKVLQKYADVGICTIGDRWKGGKLVMQPGKTGLQPKEIPIETFFSKIVMMRDRLRVLEQRVNASGLDAEDKINLQQYITRCYGSMTTFNLLFADADDYFVGEKSS